jgi:hypothetical protein
MQNASADITRGRNSHRHLVRRHNLAVGLSKPRNCDHRGVYATPVIGTSRSVPRRLDLRPVTVKPDDATTADHPQKACAAQIHARIATAAAEQPSGIPAQISGAPGPFLRQDHKLEAVDDELPPSVGQDILRRTQTFQACDALKPRARHADDVAKFGWHLYIVDEGARWCGANNPPAIDGPPLGFGSDDRKGLRPRGVGGLRQNPSPTSGARSRCSIARTRRANALRPSLALGSWGRPRSWRRWRTRLSSGRDAISRLGSGWCHARIQPGANRSWGRSPSGARTRMLRRKSQAFCIHVPGWPSVGHLWRHLGRGLPHGAAIAQQSSLSPVLNNWVAAVSLLGLRLVSGWFQVGLRLVSVGIHGIMQPS